MTWLLESEVVSEGLVVRSAPPMWVIFLVILPALRRRWPHPPK